MYDRTKAENPASDDLGDGLFHGYKLPFIVIESKRCYFIHAFLNHYAYPTAARHASTRWGTVFDPWTS